MKLGCRDERAMPLRLCYWTDEAEEHLAEHGITRDDYEDALANVIREVVGDSSGRPAVFGRTGDGRILFCVFEVIDELFVLPVSGYEVGRP
jgi:uncharacterized DUF497 family protein